MKNDKKYINYQYTISLGKRIKEIIALKKLKLRNVAHDADLDVENLRKYIKGTQEMKISTLIRIVRALDVNIEELFLFLKIDN